MCLPCLYYLWSTTYLVEANEVSKTAGADGIEETEGSDSINVSSVLGHVEGDLDVRLSAQVVNLGREDLGDDVDEAGRVSQVTVVKAHLGVYSRKNIIKTNEVLRSVSKGKRTRPLTRS